MISIARTLGAPDKRAGRERGQHDVEGGVAVGDLTGHRRLQMHDVAVAADVHELDHLDRARPADPTQIVAAQVDQHHVLGPLLRVGEQFRLQGGVLLRGRRRAAWSRRSGG